MNRKELKEILDIYPSHAESSAKFGWEHPFSHLCSLAENVGFYLNNRNLKEVEWSFALVRAYDHFKRAVDIALRVSPNLFQLCEDEKKRIFAQWKRCGILGGEAE